jgi:hypothetical protein
MTDVACGYIQIVSLGGDRVFSTSEAEAQVDLLAQNPPNGLGVSVIQINFDPYYWIDQTNPHSVSALAEFQAVMRYIYNTYGQGSTHTPVVHVRLEPSYLSGTLALVCPALTGQMSFSGPADVATCVTSVPASAPWLKIGGTQYSVYGYLAAYYGPGTLSGQCTTISLSCPVMQDFSDIHEPTSINNNSNYNWCVPPPSTPCTGTGTAGNWQTAFTAMANVAYAQNSSVSNGIALTDMSSHTLRPCLPARASAT